MHSKNPSCLFVRAVRRSALPYVGLFGLVEDMDFRPHSKQIVLCFLQTANGRMPSGMVALSLVCLSAALCLVARSDVHESLRLCEPSPGAVQRWQAMRLGLFIHWGPVSIKGTEIGWSRGREVPIDEYDSLFKQFNPTNFNAESWVLTAKEAGARYLVITAKHHDGFCLWDSEYTDYDIMSTPLRRDVLRELSDACRRHGLVFCTYYSILDWYHPDYPLGSPGGRTSKPNPNMSRYVDYMKSQLREIITKYGPIGVMWFDGQWESPWTAELGLDLYCYVRGLQPDILINNRVSKEPFVQVNGSYVRMGDYDTPEQRVGAFNRQRPWESCITLGTQWAWKPSDRIKSLKECLELLVRTVGGDGNLLLNVGPMPDGRIEPRQVERLRELGAWLARYGHAIYGTRGGPYMPGLWGGATCRGHEIFLLISRWPESGTLRLAPLPVSINTIESLSGEELNWTCDDQALTIRLSRLNKNEPISVIRIDVKGDAVDIKPMVCPSVSGAVSYRAEAFASNVYQNRVDSFGPQMAVDDDPDTRWATDSGVKEAWLEVKLQRPAVIDRVKILEAYPGRVRRFAIEFWDGSGWQTCYVGSTIGQVAQFYVQPTRAQRFRLHILESAQGPTIAEFQLFGKDHHSQE